MDIVPEMLMGFSECLTCQWVSMSLVIVNGVSSDGRISVQEDETAIDFPHISNQS